MGGEGAPPGEGRTQTLGVLVPAFGVGWGGLPVLGVGGEGHRLCCSWHWELSFQNSALLFLFVRPLCF